MRHDRVKAATDAFIMSWRGASERAMVYEAPPDRSARWRTVRKREENGRS
jgi:hypothetical protein